MAFETKLAETLATEATTVTQRKGVKAGVQVIREVIFKEEASPSMLKAAIRALGMLGPQSYSHCCLDLQELLIHEDPDVRWEAEHLLETWNESDEDSWGDSEEELGNQMALPQSIKDCIYNVYLHVYTHLSTHQYVYVYAPHEPGPIQGPRYGPIQGPRYGPIQSPRNRPIQGPRHGPIQ